MQVVNALKVSAFHLGVVCPQDVQQALYSRQGAIGRAPQHVQHGLLLFNPDVERAQRIALNQFESIIVLFEFKKHFDV